MRKKLSIMLVLVAFLTIPNRVAYSQSDLTFYHLGEDVPQSIIYSPIFFPRSKVYVSLPGMSGVAVNMNNSFSYGEIISQKENNGSVYLNPQKFIVALRTGDRLAFDATITLIQVGFRIGQTSAVHIFTNERVKAEINYPVSLINYVLLGNKGYLGQEVKENNLGGAATHYREYGVGYSHRISISEEKKLRVGVKMKYLQGVTSLKTDNNTSLSLLTSEEDHSIKIRANNLVVNTVGLDSLDNIKYFIKNDNKGLGFDIGADFQFNEKWSIALSVNDIGAIDWSSGVENHRLSGADSLLYEGVDFAERDNALNILTDTLKQFFDFETGKEKFRSRLHTRVFLSGSYQTSLGGTVSSTVSARRDLNKINFTYGAGYTHKFEEILTLSATVAHRPNLGVTVGGGFAVRFGFFQLYSVIDNFIGIWDVRNMQNASVRFGINFLFARLKKETDLNNERFSPFPPEYNLDHLLELSSF